MSKLAERLTQAEERQAKAEAAVDASFANHVTAVGALVPSEVSLAFEGRFSRQRRRWQDDSPVEAVEIVRDALKRPDHQADASEILTALLLAGDGFWQDGAMYFRAEAYVNLMDPTYSAVWDEARAAETETFAARKALEQAMRAKPSRAGGSWR